jgi:hypothetical protein
MTRRGSLATTIVFGVLAFIVGIIATVLVKAHIARRAQPWRQADAWALPVEPRHLASAGDQVVVCGGRLVLWLGSGGVAVARQELSEEPLRIAIQADGTTWAASAASLWRLERNRPPERIAPLAARPLGLAAGDGQVWTADIRGLQRQVPPAAQPEVVACDIGRDGGELRPAPAGGVWIALPARDRLERWKDGKAEEAFTPCTATGFAVFPDGRFATAGGPGHQVRVLARDGTAPEVVVAVPPEVAGTVPAVDARGRLLVLDPPGRRIRVFERQDR